MVSKKLASKRRVYALHPVNSHCFGARQQRDHGLRTGNRIFAAHMPPVAHKLFKFTLSQIKRNPHLLTCIRDC